MPDDEQAYLIYRAKKMRQEPTHAEKIIWRALRNRQINGWKFYRQKTIGYYITDFYCPELKLIIEIDGDSHVQGSQPAYDIKRTKWLENEGCRIMRFTNLDVYHNLDEVLNQIASAKE